MKSIQIQKTEVENDTMDATDSSNIGSVSLPFTGFRKFIFYFNNVVYVMGGVYLLIVLFGGIHTGDYEIDQALDLGHIASYSENRLASPIEKIIFVLPIIIWLTAMWKYFSWKNSGKEAVRLMLLDLFSVYFLLGVLDCSITAIVSIHDGESIPFSISAVILVLMLDVYFLFPIIKERGLQRGFSIRLSGENESTGEDHSSLSEPYKEPQPTVISAGEEPSLTLREHKKRHIWINAVLGLVLLGGMIVTEELGFSWWIFIPAGIMGSWMAAYLIGKVIGMSVDEILSNDKVDAHNLIVATYGIAMQFALLSNDPITANQKDVIDAILPENDEIKKALANGLDDTVSIFEYADYLYKAAGVDDEQKELCNEFYQFLWMLAAASVTDNALNIDQSVVLRKITKHLGLPEEVYFKYEKEAFQHHDMMADLEDSIKRLVKAVERRT